MIDLPMIEEIIETNYQEIIELKKVKPKLALNYGTNNNYILNMVKNMENKKILKIITIDGFKHGLSRLEFHSQYIMERQEVD